MPELPVRCLRCGFEFVPRGGMIFEGTNTNVTIVGGGADPCPKCGGATQWVQGTFNVREGGFEVL